MSEISATAAIESIPSEELALQKAEALENAQRLDRHVTASDPDVDALVDELFGSLQWPTEKMRRDEVYNHLQVVLLNLYEAWLNDPERFVRYSRRTGAYTKSRYNNNDISYRHLTKVVDALAESGLIENNRGIPGRSSFQRGGKQARMRATSVLTEKFARITGCIIVRTDEEIIILRSKKDPNDKGKATPVDYPETDETRAMRERLTFVNAELAKARISLYVSDQQMREISEKLKRDKEEKNRGPINFARVRLRRIFNDGEWDRGGRFYHGWWQEIPKEHRALILINDRQTVEIDYSGIHIAIFYDELGLPIPEWDLYTVPDGRPEHRDLRKRAMNILINAKSLPKARGKIRKEIRLDAEENQRPLADYPTAEALIAALKDAHPRIARFFHSGEGVRAQYKDSQMAEKAMLSLLGQGIVVLPVHDSFLVEERYESNLLEAMENAFGEVVTHTNKVKLKGKKPAWYETKNGSASAWYKTKIQRPELTMHEPPSQEHYAQYSGYCRREREWQRRMRKLHKRTASQSPTPTSPA